jgi:hypothetical protein
VLLSFSPARTFACLLLIDAAGLRNRRCAFAVVLLASYRDVSRIETASDTDDDLEWLKASWTTPLELARMVAEFDLVLSV